MAPYFLTSSQSEYLRQRPDGQDNASCKQLCLPFFFSQCSSASSRWRPLLSPSYTTFQAVSHWIHRRGPAGLSDAVAVLFFGDPHVSKSGSLAEFHRRERLFAGIARSRLHRHGLFRHSVSRQHFRLAGCLSGLFDSPPLESLSLLPRRICFRVSRVHWRDAAGPTTVFELVVGLNLSAANPERSKVSKPARTLCRSASGSDA